MMEKLAPWRELIDKEGLVKVAVAQTPLLKSWCNTGECNIGNFLTEAGVHYYIRMAEKDEWTYAAVALTHVGSIPVTLNKGGN